LNTAPGTSKTLWCSPNWTFATSRAASGSPVCDSGGTMAGDANSIFTAFIAQTPSTKRRAHGRVILDRLDFLDPLLHLGHDELGAPQRPTRVLVGKQLRPGVHLDAECAQDAANAGVVALDQHFDLAET